MSCLGLKLKKPKSTTLLVHQLLEHGQIVEKLEAKNNHQDVINTGSKKEKNRLMMITQEDIQLYMPESHLLIMILYQ